MFVLGCVYLQVVPQPSMCINLQLLPASSLASGKVLRRSEIS